MNGPHLATQLVLLLSAVPVFLYVSVSAVGVEVVGKTGAQQKKQKKPKNVSFWDWEMSRKGWEMVVSHSEKELLKNKYTNY